MMTAGQYYSIPVWQAQPRLSGLVDDFSGRGQSSRPRWPGEGPGTLV